MTDLKNLPDRDLDAWLAEHAMGWKWYRVGKSRVIRATDSWMARSHKPDADLTEPIADPDVFPMGALSSDPAASKALRDRMRELGWDCEVSTAAASDNVFVKFSKRGCRLSSFCVNSSPEFRAVAETAAAALGYGKEGL